MADKVSRCSMLAFEQDDDKCSDFPNKIPMNQFNYHSTSLKINHEESSRSSLQLPPTPQDLSRNTNN